VGDFTERVTPSQKLDAVPDDPADNRILECAVEGKSEYLVTRDKHLLRLGRYGGTKMIKVADFLVVAQFGFTQEGIALLARIAPAFSPVVRISPYDS
jgi:hypothetical protein